MRERLPDEDGDLLHTGRFANHGRASLQVAALRAVQYTNGAGETKICNFDLSMGSQIRRGDLATYVAAHVHLEGPTSSNPAVSALAERVNESGTIEVYPSK